VRGSLEKLMIQSKIMTHLIFLLALAFSPLVHAFQQAPAEVGVKEKLGSSVALDSVLRDEQGKPVTLRGLIQKPTILTLNYFRCAGICTPLLNSVADVINQVGLEPGKDFQVITVSFDPSDTPEIAEQKQINYLKLMKRPVAPAAWRFLTGDAVNTKRVSDSVGFHFRADKDQFVHPGVIIMLTPAGTVSHYLYGISFLPAEVQMSLQEAAAGQVSPTISRFLAFCYSYDPESRRYVLSATRLAGIAVLVFAAAFILFLYLGRSRGSKDKTGFTE